MVSQRIRWCGLVAVTAGLFFAWSLAPILGTVSLQTWRLVGMLGAGLVGVAGAPLIASWTRAVPAIGVGLLLGVLCAELATTTDELPSIAGLMDAVDSLGVELVAMIAAAAAGDATARWLWATSGRRSLRGVPERRRSFATVADRESRVLHAALAGDATRLRETLDAGDDVDAWDENGMTPLLSAIFIGDSEAIRLLLAAGADPNRANRHDPTATLLWHARDDFGLHHIAALLVEAGAKDDTAA